MPAPPSERECRVSLGPRFLANPERPVQLIIAGKSHPEDRVGKALIDEWIDFIRQPETRHHIDFLSDYDMLLTEHLVQGVDVWINTPRRLGRRAERAV